MAERHFGEDYGKNPAENYEKYFVPAIAAPFAEDLVAVAALAPRERVLDVACGTGVVARLAARLVSTGGAVAGLDPNPGMLAVARAAAPPGTEIEWHQAGAEAMPLADASFDVVLCQMGLQFVPDKRAAVGEMRRVLVDGGRLVLNVPGPIPRLFAVLAEVLARHLGSEVAGFVQAVFSLHDTEAVRDLVAGAGFAEVAVAARTHTLLLPQPADFLWQYVHSTPLFAAVAGVSAERRAAIEEEVVAGWRPFESDRGLVLEARMVVATGRK